MSAMRREMLMSLRAEEEEEWQDLTFHGPEVSLSLDVVTSSCSD